MQQEHYVSATKIAVCTLWSTVVVLMAGSWVFGITGINPAASDLLAYTASALSAAAAVAHIKIYAMKATALIRIVGGIPREDPREESAGLKSVR